ncbi:MAG: glutamate-1-semialdehyde 2,1-aminomutase, partial [Woeseiaceae bacterium]
TRPASIEVEFAEELCSVIPCADMVKFAKDGSTVTTAAVKLARAYTGREDVAFCQDHPFFSYNDWFIGTTPLVGGIPADGAAHSFAFKYNDIESLKNLFTQYPGRIACVIMEPEREDPPEDHFLHRVKDLCTQHGALLIFDEMITGFRWAIGGAQEVHDVIPDLATFGKALANGFALSALVGRRDIMELGGIHHDKDRVFLLSTTHGAENHAIAASRATLEFYRTYNVVDRLHEQGKKLLDGAKDAALRTGMSDYFRVFGRTCNLAYQTLDDNGVPSQTHRTLFLQELIRNGVIAPSLVVSFSHSDDDIAKTVEAIESALLTLKKAQGKDIQEFIVGDSIKSVYRRKN